VFLTTPLLNNFNRQYITNNPTLELHNSSCPSISTSFIAQQHNITDHPTQPFQPIYLKTNKQTIINQTIINQTIIPCSKLNLLRNDITMRLQLCNHTLNLNLTHFPEISPLFNAIGICCDGNGCAVLAFPYCDCCGGLPDGCVVGCDVISVG